MVAELVAAYIGARRTGHQLSGVVDGGSIPASPVLIVEADELPGDIGTGAPAGVLRKAESEQSSRFVVGAQRVRVAGEPHRLGTEIDVDDDGAGGRAEVALVEDEVDDSAYLVEASSRASSSGGSKEMPAVRIFVPAHTSRLAIAASDTRKAAAIWPTSRHSGRAGGRAGRLIRCA